MTETVKAVPVQGVRAEDPRPVVVQIPRGGRVLDAWLAADLRMIFLVVQGDRPGPFEDIVVYPVKDGGAVAAGGLRFIRTIPVAGSLPLHVYIAPANVHTRRDVDRPMG